MRRASSSGGTHVLHGFPPGAARFSTAWHSRRCRADSAAGPVFLHPAAFRAFLSCSPAVGRPNRRGDDTDQSCLAYHGVPLARAIVSASACVESIRWVIVFGRMFCQVGMATASGVWYRLIEPNRMFSRSFVLAMYRIVHFIARPIVRFLSLFRATRVVGLRKTLSRTRVVLPNPF